MEEGKTVAHLAVWLSFDLNCLWSKIETFLKQRLALDDRHVKLLEKKYYNFLQTLYDEPLERSYVIYCPVSIFRILLIHPIF